jgi:hypothetical protein
MPHPALQQSAWGPSSASSPSHCKHVRASSPWGAAGEGPRPGGLLAGPARRTGTLHDSQCPVRRGREDLRDLVVCSVDPPGCKDIDDALHARPLAGGNLELGVHIADVTHFLEPGSAMDDEAAARCARASGAARSEARCEPRCMRVGGRRQGSGCAPISAPACRAEPL